MKVLKDWIIAHKLLSIVIAAVIVVGAASAVVLPIALAHKHEFAAEWTTDAENHWHACAGKDCDEVDGKALHVYDNACDATCNVCGTTRTPANHVYDDDCDATCNVCNATRTAPHAFSETWTTDAEKHWLVCGAADCDAIKDEAVHTFVTKHDETKHWQECSTCGYKKDETAHTLTVKEINVDDHVQKCDDCEYETTKQAHVFENDTATECDVCGKERTETSLKFSDAFNETNRKKVYDGTSFEFIESWVTANVNFTDIIVEYQERGDAPLDDKWTTEKPVNYGTYYIRLRVEASSSHTSGKLYEGVKYVTIEKKLLDLSSFSKVYAMTELDKSSWTETVTNANISGILPSEELTVRFYKNASVTLTEGTYYDFSTMSAEGNAFAVQITDNINYAFDATTSGKLYIAHSTTSKGSAIQSVYESESKSVKKNEIAYYAVNLVRTNRGSVEGAFSTNYGIDLSYSTVTKVVEVFSRNSDMSVKIAEDGTLLAYGTATRATIFIGVRYEGTNESVNNTFKLVEDISTKTVTDVDAWINALKFNEGGYKVVLTKNGVVVEDCGYSHDLKTFYKKCDGSETYYTIEDSDCYQYVKNEGATYWVRRKVTEYYGSIEEAKTDFLDTIKLSEKWLQNIATADAFKAFAFSNEDLAYSTETGFILGDDVRATKIALKFANDKLTWIEFTDGVDVYVIKVVNSVVSASLSKPTVYSDGLSKETAFVVPYDGNGNFVLEDVSLSAGDNWFVLEITQEMIDEYADEMNVDVTLSNGNVTLTMAIYDESDTEIAKDGTYLEGLIAGKYYVKVNVDENCTGNLNLTIAV